MPNITSDQLRDISVKVVEEFLNDKVPLTAGLAKQASVHELNSEQIQRAVEATNTIAYLKVLSLSEDRTVEFPLCKYAEVMKTISAPEAEKQASVNPYAHVVNDVPCAYTGGFDKSASEKNDPELSKHERTILFLKEASFNSARLQELMDRSEVVKTSLEKTAKEIAADEKGMDKLASVTDKETFSVLSTLVYGAPQEYRDLGQYGMFKEAELKQTKSIATLYKEARLLVSEISRRSDMEKKAHEVHGELTKEALLGTVAKGVGRAVGGVIKAPFKALTGVKNATKGKVSASTVAGTAASIGFDASMYSPGVNATTGRTKDVWDLLQNNK